MEILGEKNVVLFELLSLFHLYFFWGIIIWISLYFLINFLAKFVYNNYGRKQKNVLKELCIAVMENRLVDCVRIIECYPEYINKYNEDGYTPFLMACAAGNTQIVKIMLKKGADVRIKSWQHETPFYLACFYYVKNPKIKDASCIRELYYAGADINEPTYKGLNSLQMAAMFGHAPLVKWLLVKSAETNIQPNPFWIAVVQGHQEAAAQLT